MTISTDTTYFAAGTEVTLATTLGDADLAVFSLTSVPDASALALGKIVDAQGVATQTITFDVPGEVVDNEQYVYYVIVNGEAGANATNTSWYGCRVTTTVTSQDKAP